MRIRHETGCFPRKRGAARTITVVKSRGPGFAERPHRQGQPGDRRKLESAADRWPHRNGQHSSPTGENVAAGGAREPWGSHRSTAAAGGFSRARRSSVARVGCPGSCCVKIHQRVQSEHMHLLHVQTFPFFEPIFTTIGRESTSLRWLSPPRSSDASDGFDCYLRKEFSSCTNTIGPDRCRVGCVLPGRNFWRTDREEHSLTCWMIPNSHSTTCSLFSVMPAGNVAWRNPRFTTTGRLWAGVVREFEAHPSINSFLSSAHPRCAKRLRQVVGVVVRVIMEQRGWHKTGKKGCLGVRNRIAKRIETPGTYHNTGGLASWFRRAERYLPADGLPFRSVKDRAVEVGLVCDKRNRLRTQQGTGDSPHRAV